MDASVKGYNSLLNGGYGGYAKGKRLDGLYRPAAKHVGWHLKVKVFL